MHAVRVCTFQVIRMPHLLLGGKLWGRCPAKQHAMLASPWQNPAGEHADVVLETRRRLLMRL